MTLLTTTVVLTAVLAFGLGLSDSAPQEAPDGPGKEHDALKAFLGVWDAEIEAFGAKNAGVETVTAGGGGFFIVTDFKGEMMGAPYHGHGVTGFDSAKKKYVGIWADSSGGCAVIEGPASPDGKVFTSWSEGADPQTGKSVRFKHVARLVDAKSRTYTITVDGAPADAPPFLHIEYKKRK